VPGGSSNKSFRTPGTMMSAHHFPPFVGRVVHDGLIPSFHKTTNQNKPPGSIGERKTGRRQTLSTDFCVGFEGRSAI